MLKKRLSSLLTGLFWIAPLCFWIGWQIILLYPSAFWILIVVSLLLLLPVSYEAANRKRGWRFGFIFINLGLLLGLFYLFISLLAVNWVVQLLWLAILWYLYRYLGTAKKAAQGIKPVEWAHISLSGSLVVIFLASISLFGLQAFLSLSPWPLLGALAVIALLNTRALAFSQGWNGQNDLWLWPFLSLLTVEIVMMLSLLPLNYLIAGILSALAYYSAINFVRLYLTKSLTKRKIKSYAWFIAISLVIILLTARWL